MSNAVATQRFKDTFNAMVVKSAEAFPTDVNSKRITVNLSTYINSDPKLSAVASEKPLEIATICLNYALLGLDPMMNECYIIPFGATPTKIISAKGLRKLMIKYSVEPLLDVVAVVVYENDEFDFDGVHVTRHKFNPFADKKERGNWVGAYAKLIFKNGYERHVMMSKEDVLKAKSVSKTASTKGGIWDTWEEEMIKKTVIRRSAKTVDLDFGTSEVTEAYNKSDDDLQFNSKEKYNNVRNTNATVVVDIPEAEYTEV